MRSYSAVVTLQITFPCAGYLDEMAKLVKVGKIRSVGISNFNPEQMRRAHHQLQKYGLPLAVNQVRYSLLDRSIERNGVLETAKELEVTIIAYTPLESGLLTGKYHKYPELLEKKPVFWRARLRRSMEKSRPLISALDFSLLFSLFALWQN